MARLSTHVTQLYKSIRKDTLRRQKSILVETRDALTKEYWEESSKDGVEDERPVSDSCSCDISVHVWAWQWRQLAPACAATLNTDLNHRRDITHTTTTTVRPVAPTHTPPHLAQHLLFPVKTML